MKKGILFVSLLCAMSVTVCMELMDKKPDVVCATLYNRSLSTQEKITFIDTAEKKWLAVLACLPLELKNKVLCDVMRTPLQFFSLLASHGTYHKVGKKVTTNITKQVWGDGYDEYKNRFEDKHAFKYSHTITDDVFEYGGRKRYLNVGLKEILGGDRFKDRSVHIAQNKKFCVKAHLVYHPTKPYREMQIRWIKKYEPSIVLHSVPLGIPPNTFVFLSSDDTQCLTSSSSERGYRLWNLNRISEKTIATPCVLSMHNMFCMLIDYKNFKRSNDFTEEQRKRLTTYAQHCARRMEKLGAPT